MTARELALLVVPLLFRAYLAILLVRVILSYFRTPSYTSPWVPVWNFFYAATEPVLTPIRRALMRYMRGTPIDFSPLVLWVLLLIAERLIISLLRASP